MSGQTSFTSEAVLDFAEAVDDRVAALLLAGTGISLTYNDTAGSLTIASSFDGTFAALSGKPTTLAGYGIGDAQPLDADLTAIAALTTTTYGRSLLTQADASATRTTLGLGTSATLNAGSANGVATLGADSKLTAAQIPDISLISYLGSVASQAAMLALTGQQGDWCVRSDLSTTWVITGSDPTLLANWTQLSYPSVPVQSVFGRTGAVVGVSTDYSSVGITNTAIGASNPSTGAFTSLSANSATLSAGTLNGTVLDIAQTWGGTGTYTGLRYNVTDSGPANAASLLMDFQVGGTSRFNIDKNGKAFFASNIILSSTADTQTNIYRADGRSLFLRAAGNSSGFYVDGWGQQIAFYGSNGFDCRDIAGTGWSQISCLRLTLAGDVILQRDATGILAQRNDTSAQALRIYKTYSGGGTNYERGVLDWQTTADVLRIGTEAGGTGTVRNIALVGGNVGIGTTSPGQKLEVNGRIFASTTSGQPALLIQGPAASFPGVYARLNTDSANTSRIGFEVGDSDSPWIFFGPGGAGPYDTSISRPSAGKVYIGTRYQNSYDGTLIAGNVGIGLTSPAAKLDISDTTGAGSGSLQASALNIAQTWSTTGTPTAIKLNVTDTASNAASLFAAFQFAGVSRYEFAKTAFRLYNTNDASTANYERAKIAWESNVLRIGTEKLGTGSGRALELQTDGTTRLTIASTGAAAFSDTTTFTKSTVGGGGGVVIQVGYSAGATFPLYPFRLLDNTGSLAVSMDYNSTNGGSVGLWLGGTVSTLSNLAAGTKVSSNGQGGLWVASASWNSTPGVCLRTLASGAGEISGYDPNIFSTSNTPGKDILIRGGDASGTGAGNRNGGSVFVRGGQKLNSGTVGNIHLAHDGTNQLGRVLVGTATDDNVNLLQVAGSATFSGNLTLSAVNLVTDTTTGTKIGTATTQKLGFWNATPDVQPTTAVAAATLVGGGGNTITDTDTFDGYTLKQIVKALRNIGLLA